jgi:hypothetical protein
MRQIHLRRLAASGAPILAFLAFLATLAMAALSAACGGKPPQIAAIEWRIETRPSLSDEDGAEDIEQIWVLNDRERLAWGFDNATWTKKTEGDAVWIGSAGLTLSDYSKIPKGEYRILVLDRAGERSERDFSVDADHPGTPAPVLALSGGSLSLGSAWPENVVLAYDAAGSLIAALTAPTTATPLAEFLGPAGQRCEELGTYGYNPGSRSSGRGG